LYERGFWRVGGIRSQRLRPRHSHLCVVLLR